MDTTSATALPPAPPATRFLYRVALLIFAITVLIGILNGIDAVEFDRNTLLTHVHAGTLGWITLAVIATILWLFEPDGSPSHQPLAAGAVGAVLIYVVGFASGDKVLRPVAGSLMFLVAVGVLAWLVPRTQGVMSDLPRFALLLAWISFTIGAVFGILLGLVTSGVADWIPDGVAEAHPPTMVIGYLILAGMGFAEWRLLGDRRGEVTRLGLGQVWLLFGSGVLLTVGIIFDIEPLIMVSAPLELIGVGIFVVRLRSVIPRTSWMVPGGRAYVLSTLFLAFNIIMLLYLVANYADDFEQVPTRLFLTIDHAMFIGVMTNALLGMVEAALPKRSSDIGSHVWFWGVNGGLVLFIIGLLSETVVLKRIGTPIMGLALLHAISSGSIRLSSAREST